MENEVKTSIKWKEKCRSYEELENEDEKWTKRRITKKNDEKKNNSPKFVLWRMKGKKAKFNCKKQNINKAFTTVDWRTSRKQSVRDKSKYNNNKHYQ